MGSIQELLSGMHPAEQALIANCLVTDLATLPTLLGFSIMMTLDVALG